MVNQYLGDGPGLQQDSQDDRGEAYLSWLRAYTNAREEFLFLLSGVTAFGESGEYQISPRHHHRFQGEFVHPHIRI